MIAQILGEYLGETILFATKDFPRVRIVCVRLKANLEGIYFNP
jgi:hypothetical protein